MRERLVVWSIAAGLALGAALAWASTATASVGTVTATSDGCEITVQWTGEPSTDPERIGYYVKANDLQFEANDSGIYFLVGLPNATYTVQVFEEFEEPSSRETVTDSTPADVIDGSCNGGEEIPDAAVPALQALFQGFGVGLLWLFVAGVFLGFVEFMKRMLG